MVRKIGKDPKCLWKDNITRILLSNGMSLNVIEGADATLSLEAVADTTQTLVRFGPGNTTSVFSSAIIERLLAGFVFDSDTSGQPRLTASRSDSTETLTLPILRKLSNVEYRLGELEDWELAVLAVICFDKISYELTGFTRLVGTLPWEAKSTRCVLAWSTVCNLFELFVGTSFDTVMSGLEDSEIEQIRTVYGDPIKNAKAS